MEEVGERWVLCRGFRAAGWSPRARCSGSKRLKRKVKGSKTKNKKKRDENGKNSLVPLNAWAQLLLGQNGDPRGSGGVGSRLCVCGVEKR